MSGRRRRRWNSNRHSAVVPTVPRSPIADFDGAIKVDQRYATAFYHGANAKLDGGDKAGAIEDYRQAVTLRPGFKEAADMLKQLGAK
jgi:hypothetical protein